MADLSKTVEIIFGAKDNVTVTVKNLESNLKDFDATVQSVAAPLADVGNKILAMETAVLALSAAFVGKAISAAGEFGDSVREIGTLFGGTTDQVNAFGTDIQNYAAASTQSIESINGAIYEAISSGVKYEDSIKFISDAERLAVAGRADLTQVTDVLTGTLNAYGASTEEAANYTDDLLTAVNLGKTTVPELANSLANVTSIAAAAGVPFSDLSAAVAGVTAAGKPTAEAVTAIRGVLETFVSPSGAAAKAASELGISLDTTTLKSKGLDGALKDIYAATGGTVEGLSKIFTTTEGLQGALVLGADKSGVFAKALKEMETNSGATAKAYETMSQSFEVASQRMANAADVAMIKAGQPLLDEFGGVANGIAAIFQSLGKGIDSGAFDPIIQALEAFGVSASGTLKNIAENLPEALAALDFGPLLKSLENLGGSVGEAFSDIFGNIDLDTPEGLSAALQTIVNGIAGLTNVTAGIVDSFSPIFTAFGDLAREAGSAGEESQTAAGQFLGVAQQIVAFGTGLTAALTLFQQTGTSIVSVIDVFAGGVKIAFNGVQIAIDGVGAIILQTLKTIADGFALVLPGDIGERWAQKSAEFGGLLEDLKDRTAINTADMAEGWDRVTRGLDGIGNSAKPAAESLDALATSGEVATQKGEAFTALDWSQGATGIDYVGEAAKRLGISMGEAESATTTSKAVLTTFGDISGQTEQDLYDLVAAAEKYGAEMPYFIQESTGKIGGAFIQMSGYIKTAGDETDIARAKANGYKLEIDDLGNRTYIRLQEETKKTADETKKAAKEMEEAAKKAVEYDLKLQEIASAERIAYVEAKFKLDEAQLEADTQRLTAAFESINTSITSTGETLTGLISSWAGMDNSFESAKLWHLIEAEEKRREEAFAQQKTLLDEQIKYMQARTVAMLKGDTLLKVEAAGLAPHLERIFHEILRACQVKANEQGLELLLGAA
jgi:TP901 family phage tail tape measure protein